MDKSYYTTCLRSMTLSHFCEDCMCAVLLYSCFLTQEMYAAFALLVYHLLAFGLQPAVGWFCDNHREHSWARMGILMTVAACFLAIFLPAPAVILAGLGNSLFHVGGGYVSLLHGSDRMAPGGVFVSGGAMGIAVGSLLGARVSSIWPAVLMALVLGTVAVILTGYDLAEEERRATTHFQVLKRKEPFSLVLILIVSSILVRGYVGFIAPMDWKNAAWMSLLTAWAATLGKALGGYLADRFGPGLVGTFCQLLAIPCLLAGSCMPLSLVGIFLLNVPMAITLAMLCECFEDYTGFAFGLAPLGLFLAYMLEICLAPAAFTARVALSVLLVISAAIMRYLAR